MTVDDALGRDLGLLPPDLILHAEDLAVGDHMTLGTTQVSEQEIIDFAVSYDPLPIHVDPVAAAQGPFGTVIASAIHTLALYSALASRHYIPRLALVAGKGIDRLRLPAPVRPGVELTATTRVEQVVAREGRADVHARAEFHDSAGQVVMSFVGVQVVRSRAGR